MPKQIQSRLIINGYTINPVTNIDALNQVMNGLVSYDSNHSCDLTKGVNIHKNYLGKSLCEPFSIIVKEKDNGGMIGQAFLENGYFTIRIWDKVYPAEVQFDLYLRSELKDIDLIMDHLCNPATPYDGFGLFDCTYSLNHEYIKSSPLSKFNKEQSSYFVNDTLQNNEHGWHVTLNELDELFCYFCDKKAEFWIFLNRSCHENTDHKYNDIQVE